MTNGGHLVIDNHGFRHQLTLTVHQWNNASKYDVSFVALIGNRMYGLVLLTQCIELAIGVA